MTRVNREVEKKCGLADCQKLFIPKVPWQLCCSLEHAKRLRYLRRKHRIMLALEAQERLEASAEGAASLP